MWLGVFFSSAVHWMEYVALAWLVYQMSDSPFLVGAISGARSLPFLLFGPLAGALADRVDRKRQMVWSQVVILIFYVALLLLLITEQMVMWHLFAFTLGSSIAYSFNQPARHALLPVLVPKEDLMNASALQTMSHNITRVVGPTAAGLLMAFFGVTPTFLVVVLTLVAVLITTLLITPPGAPGEDGDRRAGAFLNDLVEGFRYVQSDGMILGLLLFAMIPIVFGMSFMALMPVFARDVFGMDARGVGELLAASGVGSIAATLFVASLKATFSGKGMLILLSGVATGLGLIAFALSANYPLSLFLLGWVGLFSMAQVVITSASIQILTPRQYMGRVMSIYMLDRGLMPVGSFAAGAIAEWLGAPAAMAAMGAACIVLTAVGAVAMPQVTRVR